MRKIVVEILDNALVLKTAGMGSDGEVLRSHDTKESLIDHFTTLIGIHDPFAQGELFGENTEPGTGPHANEVADPEI